MFSFTDLPFFNLWTVAHRISRKKPGDLKFFHNLLFGRRGKVKSLAQEKTPLDLPDANYWLRITQELGLPWDANFLHGWQSKTGCGLLINWQKEGCLIQLLALFVIRPRRPSNIFLSHAFLHGEPGHWSSMNWDYQPLSLSLVAHGFRTGGAKALKVWKRI